jgi:putative ABC transport system substrate-binding protein
MALPDRRLALRTLAALAGALALPSALAQAPRKPRVAILMYGAPANFTTRAGAFIAGMKALGYIDGRDVVYDWRTANGQDDVLQQIARELAKEDVDVVLSPSDRTTHALQRSGIRKPVVMAAADEPVASGFVKTIARPQTNFTGLTTDVLEHVPRLLEYLEEAVPRMERAVALVNPANPIYKPWTASLKTAAQKSGVRLELVEAASSAQIDRAFADRLHADGVVVMSDPLFYNERKQIVGYAELRRRPAVYPLRGYVEAGGLMSYGPVIEENFARAASFVDRLLKGANPQSLAIEGPPKYELVLNRKSARTLGLALPEELVKRADRVIG